MRQGVYVGCAGWNIPGDQKRYFNDCGSHLERYASRFNAVEINSSFYRPHRRATYERWADSVPEAFRFTVKMPKTITHIARLEGASDPLKAFLGEVAGLGMKLGCILIQLPPSFVFQPSTARNFFCLLREQTSATVVFEPRHATWSQSSAAKILRKYDVSMVDADPPVPGNTEREQRKNFAYHRFHGAPRMYYSKYPRSAIRELANRIADEKVAWCIFDNTALGHATENARELLKELRKAS